MRLRFFKFLIAITLLSPAITLASEPPERCADQVAQHLNRAQFILEYSTRIATSPIQNETWMKAAARQEPDGKTLFLVIENAALKRLNESMKDKALPTALTNKHQELDIEEINQVLKSFPLVKALIYSDYKSVKYAFRSKSKKIKLPTDFHLQLEAAYSRAQSRYRNYILGQDIIRESDGDPSTWYRGGTGATADQASITARVSRILQTPDALLDFQSEIVQRRLEAYLSAIHSMQEQLVHLLDIAPAMFELPMLQIQRESGQKIIGEKICDLCRKYPEPSLLKGVIAKRFGLFATDEQIGLIQDYARTVDIFSPAIYIRNRQIASLADAKHGGVSFDFVGQGGVNLCHTAHALSDSLTVEKAIISVRSAEESVTKEFAEKMKLVAETIEFVLHRHNYTGVIRRSGDDMVLRPDQALNAEFMREIGEELIKVVSPSSLRVAFVDPNHQSTYDELISLGENLEKQTRAKLEGVIQREILENVLLIVEVGGHEPKLLAIARVELSANEMAQIQQAFRDVSALR